MAADHNCLLDGKGDDPFLGIPWLLRAIVILVVSFLAFGCDRSLGRRTSEDIVRHGGPGIDANRGDKPEQRSVDYLGKARRMLQTGDLESAAESAYKALVQDPDNVDATFIASQVEAARGNHQASADLAGSIDVGSRLGARGVEVHWQQLLKLNRPSEAADVILAALNVVPAVSEWRHHAWSLLNRVGRREEASRQADALCRAGQANEQELFSLLRRNDSFPFLLKEDESPKKYFQSGLGLARWYFTQRDYRRGLEELSQEYQAGFPTPAAGALYGRLLAETQSYEEMPAWYAKCGKPVHQYADFWAALGTFFFDDHQFEASARALLEAVVRDPTDHLSVHRLAKVFDALGRPNEGDSFRQRGILIVQSKQDSETLIQSPSQLNARKELTRKLVLLGRPFEALEWSLSMLPSNSANQQAIAAQRAAVANQRAALIRDDRAVRMAAESSLNGIDRAKFSLEPAIEKLRRDSAPTSKTKSSEVETLAVPRLVNVARQVGLQFQWYQDREINLASIPIHEMMGGSIAVIDYDRDGWPDVYLAQGSGDPPTDACTRSSVLFRNVAARFEAVTSMAQCDDFNYSSGIAAGDVNQDGFTDLFLGSLGHNRLLINNGDGTFGDATENLGDVADRFTSSLAIADVNGDALPDLFEAIYIEMEDGFSLPEVGPDGREILPTPLSHYAQSDRWYENLGNGSFQVREISEEIAIAGTSLGVVVTDFDSDGTNEIFIGNDARPNHFLVQAGGNRFENMADAKGVANGFGGAADACMGIATGDFNRDGTLDLSITNFSKESSNLFLQAGGGFTDFAARYGIDALSVGYVGFGTKAVDIDRNGWLDLIVTNGHVFDRRSEGEPLQMPPQVLINRGNRFDQVAVDDDSGYWDNAFLGRSMAIIDYDRNGAIDLLVGHLDQPLALLDNQTRSTGDWIQFELVGAVSERDAIGTRVVLTAGDEQQSAWVTAGDGYLCSDQPIIDFGLGKNRGIDRVEIFWPSGIRQTFGSLQPNRRYLIVEGDSEIDPQDLQARGRGADGEKETQQDSSLPTL